MTPRERILSVYGGRIPDAVPFMLDLSHWFYHRFRRPWDLSRAFLEPEVELIEYHRQASAGFYLANLGSFYDVAYDGDVKAAVERDDSDGGKIAWTLTTSLGRIRRVREWEDGSYSWAIREFPLGSREELEILAYAASQRRYTPAWERYEKWVEAVGDLGVVYVSPGYSAMGELLGQWMGIEKVMYAVADDPGFMHGIVDEINEACLRCIDLLAESPAEIVLMGDNFSSDVQSPRFFKEWSRDYYAEAVRRLHRAGKYVAVHVDGRMRGLLNALAEIGVDCIDAVTPKPMGDLTPQECRDEAGHDLILSGGVAPNLWLPEVPLEAFRKAVMDWLELRKRSPRLIANAGDQVPPCADEQRIAIMRDLVERHGRF